MSDKFCIFLVHFSVFAIDTVGTLFGIQLNNLNFPRVTKYSLFLSLLIGMYNNEVP